MKKLNFKGVSELLSSDKARLVFVFIGLGAILLIFLSSQFSNNNSSEKPTAELSASAYTEALCAELNSMIESIEGAGETQVLLTLESSYEYVYLDDDKTLTKILEPKVRGVAVACVGGDDPVVREKVTSLLTTVLNIKSGNVSVSKLT